MFLRLAKEVASSSKSTRRLVFGSIFIIQFAALFYPFTFKYATPLCLGCFVIAAAAEAFIESQLPAKAGSVQNI